MKAGISKEKGWGLWSFALLLVGIAFAAVVVLRLMPIYLNHFKIVTHINEIAQNEETNDMSKGEIRETIEKRFGIDNVEFIDPRKDIEIVSDKKNQKTIKVNYEAKVKFIYNLSVIGEFKDLEVQVTGVE